MRRVASDHCPNTDDCVVAAAHRQYARGARRFEAAGHPDDVDAIRIDPMSLQPRSGTGQQPFGDDLIETSGDDADREPRAVQTALVRLTHRDPSSARPV